MLAIVRHAAALTARRTISLALLVGTFVLVSHLMPTTMQWAPPELSPQEDSAPSRAERLVERHGCWTGEAPPDVDMPGHVVWQHPDGRVVYSARLVGPALDTLFGSGDLAGQAVAFCR